MSDRRENCSRRAFVRGLTLVGTAGLVGGPPERVAAEPPPETTTLRISVQRGGICVAPQWVAEELLRGEGFTDLQYQWKDRFGHSILDSSLDRPWSQYFCCVVAANRDFVNKHPVATKRAVRALMKATDVCALEPERAARFLVDRGYTERYDYALAALRAVPYRRWRESPEDSVRFYALRLHEAGMIKSSPQKILGQGTNWRFLNELKKELQG